MAARANNTLHNGGWQDVLENIDPFAFAGLGTALALTLCVIGAAWCVPQRGSACASCRGQGARVAHPCHAPTRSLSPRALPPAASRVVAQGHLRHGRLHLGRVGQGAAHPQQEPDLRHLLRGDGHLRGEAAVRVWRWRGGSGACRRRPRARACCVRRMATPHPAPPSPSLSSRSRGAGHSSYLASSGACGMGGRGRTGTAWCVVGAEVRDARSASSPYKSPLPAHSLPACPFKSGAEHAAAGQAADGRRDLPRVAVPGVLCGLLHLLVRRHCGGHQPGVRVRVWW